MKAVAIKNGQSSEKTAGGSKKWVMLRCDACGEEFVRRSRNTVSSQPLFFPQASRHADHFAGTVGSGGQYDFHRALCVLP
jgi:hypothetical protein